MAVTITSNLVTVDVADNENNWVSDDGSFTGFSGFQREGTACLGELASNSAVHGYATITSADLSSATIIGPWLRAGNPTTQATGGFRIVVGDATNLAAFYMGGSDNYGFFYNGYSLFRLDLAQDNVGDVALEGSATITTTATTRVGGGWNYASKAVGSSPNVFLDVVRYISNGTAALVIGGGTAVAPGNFAEVVAEDESTTNAYGIIRTLATGTKAYELNFGIDIGSTTADSYFSDSDFQLFVSGDAMSAGNMDINFLANAGSTNELTIDNFVIVNTGTAGNWDLSSADSDKLELTDGQFVDCGTISLPVASVSRLCNNTSFVNCGQVDPSTIEFANNSFSGTTDANGAMLIAASTSNMSNLTFTSDGTGHAIYITATGTYDFNDFKFNGYGADSTTDAVVYNNSGGAVTINVTGGGDTPTVRNGTGASTTVNNNVSITLSNMKDNSEVRVYDNASPITARTELAGVEVATNGTIDDRSFTFSVQAGTILNIVIFNIDYEPVYFTNYTAPSNTTTLPVSQNTDRTYENP